MSEPASGIGIVGLLKLAAVKLGYSVPAIAASMATVIVFLMTMPKTRRQQTVCLLSTFLGSIFGGAFLISYYGLSDLSPLALGAVYLASGLPVWVFLRGFFAYSERDPNKSFIDHIREIKRAWKD